MYEAGELRLSMLSTHFHPHHAKRRWHKAIALFTAIVFVATNSAIADPSGYLGGSASLGLDAKIMAQNPFGIRLDEKQGAVSGFYDGSSGLPLVIHLQDAHGNISAQENIRRIISGIASETDQKQIFCLLEGAEGYVSAAPLAAFERLGEQPEKLLLTKGMITGPEFAAAGSPTVGLFGIEDGGLYEKNLRAALIARENEARNLAFISEFRGKVRDLLAIRSSKNIKLLTAAEEQLAKTDGDLKDVTATLRKFIRETRSEIFKDNSEKPLSVVEVKRRFPNAYRLLQLDYLWEAARAELENYQAARNRELAEKQKLKAAAPEEIAEKPVKMAPLPSGVSAAKPLDMTVPESEASAKTFPQLPAPVPEKAQKNGPVPSADLELLPELPQDGMVEPKTSLPLL